MTYLMLFNNYLGMMIMININLLIFQTYILTENDEWRGEIGETKIMQI